MTLLCVVGLDSIDVEALALVLLRDPGVAVRAVTADELLAGAEQQTVLVAQPDAGVWDYAEARALSAAGHRVLVVGSFAAQQVETLEGLGLNYTFYDRLIDVRAFIAGESVNVGERRIAKPLSPRERDVAQLLVVSPALSRVEVAERAGLSPATVKLHTEHIRRKVGAVGKTRAVLIERIRALGIEAAE